MATLIKDLKATVDELASLPESEQNRANQLIKEKVRPFLARPSEVELLRDYREAAADKEREAEATEWVAANLLDPKDDLPAW